MISRRVEIEKDTKRLPSFNLGIIVPRNSVLEKFEANFQR